MNHVYILPNKKQQTILNTIKSFIAYIKKRWQYEVRILRNDQDRSLGKEYSDWLDETGITEEYSAIYTAEQNGAIERSGGVLINRSTALRLEANLPELLWSEIYKAAGYILNRSPTRALNWKTPLALLQELAQAKSESTEPEFKPLLNHIQKYGSRAYAFIQNRPRLDKLEPKA
jgi:hypothetical protein